MLQVKSIGVLSLAKIAAAVYGCLGLLILPFMLLIGMAGIAAGKQEAAAGAGFLVVFALFAPVICAAMGFLIGAFAAFVYNLFAGWMGGVQVRLEAMAPVAPAPAAYVPPPVS